MIKRHRLTRAERTALFERFKGICHLCNMHVDEGQEWDNSHEIELECGGADDETNWRVAHRRCHRKHTAKVSAPLIAKVRRVRQNAIGAKPPSRHPLPGGRWDKYKRKVGGRTVLR